MKFMFMTQRGRSFDVDCDPNEKISAIIRRAALDKGYRVGDAEIVLNGEPLEPNQTLEECGVDHKQDVLLLRGVKKGKKRPLTLAEEEEALEEALVTRKENSEKVVSLESLRDNLVKRREELEKPTFLSKAQREARAIGRREEAVRKQAEDRERKAEERKQLFAEAHEAAREAERQSKEKQTKAMREGEKRKHEEDEEKQTREELEQIKNKYLGKKKQKKVILKPSERMIGSKQFESWDKADDTSQDINPLYSNPNEAMLLFGRGMRAGVDISDQQFEEYDELVEKREQMKIMETLKLQQLRSSLKQNETQQG